MASGFVQAHGRTLEDYMVQHQDKSKNARLKSEEAAFAAWLEELRADQTQFVAEKLMCPSCKHIVKCQFAVSKIQKTFGNPYVCRVFPESFTLIIYPPPAFPRAEKEGAKTRQKMVRQLEDREFIPWIYSFVVFPKMNDNDIQTNCLQLSVIHHPYQTFKTIL